MRRLGLGLGVNAPAHFGSLGYTTTATNYDGTNDFAAKSGTNGNDSKQFTFVCGLNFTGTSLQWLWDIGPSRLAIYRGGSPFYVTIEGANPGGAARLNIRSTSPASALNSAWGVLMISLDMSNAAKRHIYIGHTSLGVTATTYTDDTLGLSSNYEFGTRIAGSNKFAGCAAPIFYADSQYIDLSVEANRLKFIDAAGKPIDYGPTGSLPLGAPPQVYAPNGDLSTNLGSAGNFTNTGAPSVCASSPTD